MNAKNTYFKTGIIHPVSVRRHPTVCHASSCVLREQSIVLQSDGSRGHDVCGPRRLEGRKVIAPIIERGNPAQLLLILRPYNEAIPRAEVLPQLLQDSFTHHLLRGSDTVLSVDDPEVACPHIFQLCRLLL